MAAIYREGNIFCQALTVPCYDTDAAFRLKPASFMDMAQEIAYWAAQELGFGYDDLQKHHTAWVLSRLHFHYVDPPRWRDEVLLRTWHKGQDGLFFLRDFELLDSSGKRIVSATSSWLVMNVETRHLVRDPQEAGLLHDGAAGAGDAIHPLALPLHSGFYYIFTFTGGIILSYTFFLLVVAFLFLLREDPLTFFFFF